MSVYQDVYYYALVGMAEQFRTADPPDIRAAVRCMLAIFEFQPPLGIKARVHSQLGKLYLSSEDCKEMARAHLEEAIALTKNSQLFDDILADATCSLVSVLGERNDWKLCKQILRETVDVLYPRNGMLYWFSNLALRLVQVLCQYREYQSAVDVLRKAYDYANRENCAHLKIVFLLNISQLLMFDCKTCDMRVHLEKAANMIDAWQTHSAWKTSMRSWFLIIQTMYHLLAGDCRSAKPCLRDLQRLIITCAEEVSPEPKQPFEYFQWMPKEHVCIVGYVLTIVHAIQCGKFEKSRQYALMAKRQIEKLNYLGDNRLLANLQLILLHCNIVTNLGIGNLGDALRGIDLFRSACQNDLTVYNIHGPSLSLLVGFYAVATEEYQEAERNFKAVLRLTREPDLCLYTNLNLGLLYLCSGRHSDFYALIGISPDRMKSQNVSMVVYSLFVRGVHLIIQNRHPEAKRALCDAVELSNRNDLSRLASFCLALIGEMLMSMNQGVTYHQECQRLFESALQIASANRDLAGQVWVLNCMGDLSSMTGVELDQRKRQMATEAGQALCDERQRSRQLLEHDMIKSAELVDHSKFTV